MKSEDILNNKAKNNSVKENISYNAIGSFSNPIKSDSLEQTRRQTMNRLFSAQRNANIVQDTSELLRDVNKAIYASEHFAQLFYSLHGVLNTHDTINFTALGICNKNSNCVDIRLLDKIGASYKTKILLQSADSIIADAILNKQYQYSSSSDFLKISFLKKSQVLIFPLIVGKKCLGVYIVGHEGSNINSHKDIYSIIAKTFALLIYNEKLDEQVSANSDVDILTNLANHKAFQEELAARLKVAKQNEEKLSICLFDILNISKINRDFGHAKGDEVIKAVANKIAENNRNTDFAGRYAGDKIAIIMPNADVEEARYVAEYLIYTTSCIYIDDVGPVKVSAGIATYPDASIDQEKLLILAEQAMCISKSKCYENGSSVVITAQDSDFWNDDALKSFAEILIRRHAQVGINIEDKLISTFHDDKNISNQHLLEVVTSLASTIDAKDTYTKGHSASVSRYSEALARALNLPEAEVERIKLGGLLHDIGKIGISENILRKPTMLTDEEWEVMKQHPTIGADKVLAPNESLKDLIPMVKYHHEHYDGTGYPMGLKGEEIPLSARIVSIADAFHALISDRPYRKGLSVSKACEILKMGANVQWDKELVRQFVQIAPSLSTSV